MGEVEDDDRTALQHAQDWRRNGIVLFVTFAIVTGVAFFAVQSGIASSWAEIVLLLAFFVSWISGLAAAICSVRIFQLSRGKK